MFRGKVSFLKITTHDLTLQDEHYLDRMAQMYFPLPSSFFFSLFSSITVLSSLLLRRMKHEIL